MMEWNVTCISDANKPTQPIMCAALIKLDPRPPRTPAHRQAVRDPPIPAPSLWAACGQPDLCTTAPQRQPRLPTAFERHLAPPLRHFRRWRCCCCWCCFWCCCPPRAWPCRQFSTPLRQPWQQPCSQVPALGVHRQLAAPGSRLRYLTLQAVVDGNDSAAAAGCEPCPEPRAWQRCRQQAGRGTVADISTAAQQRHVALQQLLNTRLHSWPQPCTLCHMPHSTTHIPVWRQPAPLPLVQLERGPGTQAVAGRERCAQQVPITLLVQLTELSVAAVPPALPWVELKPARCGCLGKGDKASDAA